jgi:hypothetical protein
MPAKFQLLCMFLMAIVSLSIAQRLPGNAPGSGMGMNLSDHLLILDSKKGRGGGAEENVDGTPYLQDEFVAANVFTTKGTYTAVPMRYNMYTDYIEFKQKDGIYVLDPRPDVRKVVFEQFSMVTENHTVKGKSIRGYFMMLDSGKVSLLERKAVAYQPAQPPKGLETEGRQARYDKPKEQFYYKLGSGALVEITTIKKMIDSLPDHQAEVSKFASQEKISRNEEELTRLVKYYNSL